ncbi:MAG TPA: glycoside hydrolase family 9 protein [Ruminococcus sp.]|nr:glycoside hydrolase family 9 protein [Ruminococcus sp.]
MFKKITSGVITAAMLVTAVSGGITLNTDAAFEANYAEALQKSLYFYECQQAGPLPEWNRVEWKADSTMTDEVLGGWYDAGDHVKFNLPMAYSASMLAWGLYQYPDGVEKCGEMTNYVNNLEFVLDYLAECDRGDEVVYQVGNGTIDHTWWGPVELIQYGMQDSGTSYDSARAILVSSDGCSAVFGEMAAALAAGSCALKDRIDQSKIDDYIAHAENIFKFADASKSNDVYNDSNASGFYRSSHFYDELFYAANWLYIATGEQSYLDKAKSYIPNLDKELGSDELKYTWCQCWDDVMQGGMLLYAINTNDDFYINRVEKHVNYWTNTIKKVDGALGYCDTWGCARYAETAGFIAAVACDTVLADKNNSDYVKFYETQMNYVLGDNADGQSFVVGYGEKSPKNPHHRTAHGSWKNDLAIPDTNRHVLYGALVGGPNQDGSYEDDRQNYINNEVATDYNAGFTALLCKMVDKYGGTTDSSFPQPEKHDGPEFYVESLVKGMDDSGATISFKMTNHSAWPARVQDNLSFRYYMDLSELISAGYSPSDLVVRCDRDQSAMYASSGYSNAEISPVTQYDGNIYYVEVSFPDGRVVLPISEGMQQCEILLALVFPNYGSGWDASNDPSNKELLNSEDSIVSMYVPVYINGELYYGTEPDGTTADGNSSSVPTTTSPTTTATKPATTTTAAEEVIYGDANCDGNVDISDAVMVKCYLINNKKFTLSKQGLLNSDVQGSGNGINAQDAVTIQKYVIKSITKLPV